MLRQLQSVRDHVPIRIAILIPMTGEWAGGRMIAGAASLAVNQVNADKSLLPGHMLEYSWADSGCSASQSLKSLGELLSEDSPFVALIGPGCSDACEVTGHLTTGNNLPQISYSCTSPILSNKGDGGYPLFSRTMAPETSKGPVVIAFMKQNKWTKAFILTSTAGVFGSEFEQTSFGVLHFCKGISLGASSAHDRCSLHSFTWSPKSAHTSRCGGRHAISVQIQRFEKQPKQGQALWCADCDLIGEQR